MYLEKKTYLVVSKIFSLTNMMAGLVPIIAITSWNMVLKCKKKKCIIYIKCIFFNKSNKKVKIKTKVIFTSSVWPLPQGWPKW